MTMARTMKMARTTTTTTTTTTLRKLLSLMQRMISPTTRSCWRRRPGSRGRRVPGALSGVGPERADTAYWYLKPPKIRACFGNSQFIRIIIKEFLMP